MKRIKFIVLAGLILFFYNDSYGQDATYNTLTLTKPYDQIKFQIPGENRYYFMSKPSTNTSFGLYSPDDGGWFTYWNTGSGNMILKKGRMGVGTPTPFYPIHIKSPSGINAIFGLEATNFTPQIRMYSGGVNIHNRIAYGTGSGTDGKFSISQIDTGSGVAGSLTDRITINSNGYVGIGVNPTYKLDVNGSAKVRSSIVVDGTDFSLGRNNSRDKGSLPNQRALVHYTQDRLYINFGGDFEGGVRIQGPKTIIDSPLGIGTTTMGDHKLAVEGTIGSREIKVEATQWYDFVFSKDYNLRSLEEVEEYVNQYQHLPDIPTEEEVQENGIYLGEMNGKLLQKIEELTLYMIEMNKRVNQLENENLQLKEDNLELKSEVSALRKGK